MKKLLIFTASWCGPCKVYKPILETFWAENPEIQVSIIDIDEQPELCAEYKIKAAPTTILISGGEEKSRATGVQSVASLKKIIDA